MVAARKEQCLMDAITKKVFIEEQYPGVTLGVISTPHGLILIDAPPSPEDGRSWRAALMGLGGGPDRILINLDPHPDRTVGVRAMDCSVVAHEKTAQVFRNRPNIFKAQGDDTGADWESIPGLTGIRWATPEITFTHTIALHWDHTPVLLESHPGPHPGAVWVILPGEKVLFVGDAVLKNQPTFLAHANLPVWIEALDLLLSKEYGNFKVISGRDGLVTATVIKNQLEFLSDVHKKLEKLSQKAQKPDMTESLVQPLLSNFKASAAHQKQYSHRLRYGLRHYYARHYQSNQNSTDE
jgi:glyoxylase-like metal-dependent hydrolase (beta-lactamase superfamily II)